ncbi:MAG TPA: helix-turn-helix transcriptional regulator [Rhizomicrobium sp.]|nr:helix-turn-helix transcriptional regulator [Rhizomicrobium sp.]
MRDSDTDDGADPLDIALGQHIRAMRRELNLSQQTLAARVGLTFQQVQKYEKGTNRVSFSRLVAIARALECTVGDLIRGIDKGIPNNATTNSMMSNMRTSGAADLLKAYSSIQTPQRRRALLDLARELAAQDDHPSSGRGRS